MLSKFYLDYIGLEPPTLEREFLHTLSNENLEAADYLLNSKELSKNVNINNVFYKSLIAALRNNQEAVIEYLFKNYYEEKRKDFIFLSDEYKNTYLNYLILNQEMKSNNNISNIKINKI